MKVGLYYKSTEGGHAHVIVDFADLAASFAVGIVKNLLGSGAAVVVPTVVAALLTLAVVERAAVAGGRAAFAALGASFAVPTETAHWHRQRM